MTPPGSDVSVLRSRIVSFTLWGNLALVALVSSLLLIVLLHLVGAPAGVVGTAGWSPFALALIALVSYLRAHLTLDAERVIIKDPLSPPKVLSREALVQVEPSNTLYSVFGGFVRLGTVAFVSKDGSRWEAKLAGGGTSRERGENYERLQAWCVANDVPLLVDREHLGQLPSCSDHGPC